MRLSRLWSMPDYRRDLIARLDFAVNGRRYRRVMSDPGYLVEEGLVQGMLDACEFLGIHTDEFFQKIKEWPALEQKLFESTGQGEKFYRSWKDEYARANICANVISQHHDRINFAVLSGVVKERLALEGPWTDYGCGTASLTITLAKAGIVPGPVSLVEMDNQVLEFVRFRISKHGLSNALSVHRVDDFEPDRSFSMVYCIDVLEHLVDPTSVFLQRIDPLVSPGGLLYIKAPWRGQLTHLEEAPEDFYRRGGRKAISKKYRTIFRAQPMDMAAVFRKIHDPGGTS